MKPGTPVLRSIRLLGQVSERIRCLHYSLSTEKAYLYWVRFFIRWNGLAKGMRHPREPTANSDPMPTPAATQTRCTPRLRPSSARITAIKRSQAGDSERPRLVTTATSRETRGAASGLTTRPGWRAAVA
jgi:hypothetical protein